MRILLIQTLALGDLALCTPLLAGLRGTYPEAQVDVLANQPFKRVLECNPAVDNYIAFPYVQLYQAANQPGEAQATAQTLAGLARFTEGLTPGYDLVFNPCFNELAAALSFLTRGPQVIGSDLTAAGAMVMRGDWPTYYHNFIDEPALNALHMADLHCLAVGVRPPAPGLQFFVREQDRQNAASLLAEMDVGPDEILVALQAGAGKHDRRWPTENFIAVGQELVRRGFRPVLTGAAHEQALAAQVAAGIGPAALNAVGRTNIGSLVALLEQCRALISNDTGTIHLASAVGLPTVAVSLGKAQFRATGPYRPGNVVLEADLDCAPCLNSARCGHMDCWRAITPADALAAFEVVLGGELELPPGSKARFYQAFMADDGWLDWRALRSDPLERAHGAMRGAWLGVLRPGASLGAPDNASQSIQEPACLAEFASLAAQACAALETIRKAISGKAPANMAQQALSRLNALGAEVRALGLGEPLVKPLAIYLTHRLASLDEPDPAIQVRLQKDLWQQVMAVAAHAARTLAG